MRQTRLSEGGYYLKGLASSCSQISPLLCSYPHQIGVASAATLQDPSRASSPWQLCLLECAKLEVALPPGNWSQVSELVRWDFSPLHCLYQKASHADYKNSWGSVGFKEMHSWVLDFHKCKNMWPERRIYRVKKNSPVGATSCRGRIYLWTPLNTLLKSYSKNRSVLTHCLSQRDELYDQWSKDLKGYICSAYVTNRSFCWKSRLYCLKTEDFFKWLLFKLGK